MRAFRPHLAAATAAALAFLATPAAAEPVTIKIIQVNDFDRIQESEGRGGYARFRAVLERENAAAPEVLVVHAGDAFSPSLLSGFDKGAHMVDLLNQVPLDLFVPGNHEFDFGPDVAKARFAEAKFPIVNSNITEADGKLLAGTVESRIVEVGGFKLGFFGSHHARDRRPRQPGRPRLQAGARDGGRDGGEAARAGRRPRGDGHPRLAGDDLALMNQGAVDLILTGHDHDLRMIYDGNVAMVESSSQADYVTVLELTVDRVKKGDKEEVVWRPNFRPIDTAAVTPDPKGAELVKAYDDRLSKELDIPVGRSRPGSTAAAPPCATRRRRSAT
jgi:2',3'-cyclic-nucleotide 2'-phosphodiesterase (5'-nucleotidase family)